MFLGAGRVKDGEGSGLDCRANAPTLNSSMAPLLSCLSLLLLCLLGSCCSSPLAERHERAMEAEVGGQRLAYVLRVPDGPAPAEGWPLLLFLHGAGERGSDLSCVQVHGPLRHVDEMPELARCILVAPQCPSDDWWRSDALLALLDEVQGAEQVDQGRVYVTGLSMGGYGTWNLLAAAPERFAAAAPVCGGGEIGRLWPEIRTGFSIERLLDAKAVPVRAFHGSADDVIPLAESERLVDALRIAGADVQLTVYEGVGHDSWTRTYADPELYRWLFSQRRAPAPPSR